jgi:hypothetical protein
MKPLDMADKYPPAENFDNEPTVKVHIPNFFPKVIVEEDPDLYGQRDTVPCEPPYPAPYEGRVYPGVGLLISIGVGLIFWATLDYIFFH